MYAVSLFASVLIMAFPVSGSEPPLSESLGRLSLRASRDLIGVSVDTAASDAAIDLLSRRVLAYTLGTQDPGRAVAAFIRVLFEEEGFVYDDDARDPENYLLERVLSRKRGNCLGLTVLCMIIGERLGIPIGGVYVPTHCFARYEGNGRRINIETAEKGADRKDAWYAEKFRLRGDSPYLSTLGKREILGVYLQSLGGAYSRRGREAEALRLYKESKAFYPGLPGAYYNEGVSHQRAGRLEEAIAQYRAALALDPGLGAARGNLGAAYCSCGLLEDGIREYRKALAIDPGNAVARANLAKAHFERGEYADAIENCDRAMEQGCRFDPTMLAVLDRYRRPRETMPPGPTGP
jgi:tetratricopeptide (TPR) repeat protein